MGPKREDNKILIFCFERNDIQKSHFLLIATEDSTSFLKLIEKHPHPMDSVTIQATQDT